MTTDMSPAIVPKSDQVNADDFMAGPQTFKIAGVSIRPGQEQPVEIALDDSKPWRPCKSMSRVLVAAWGPDAKAYVGRSVTLYRDPTVKWGGMEVGGIRVSHLSHIDTAMTMALTATKGSRKPYTVKPLAVTDPAADLIAALQRAGDMDALVQAWTAMQPDFKRLNAADRKRVAQAKDECKEAM